MNDVAPRYALHIGRRFKPANGELRLRRGNKLVRRIERHRAMLQQSRIEMALWLARVRAQEVTRLAANSHEAKRYRAAAQAETA